MERIRFCAKPPWEAVDHQACLRQVRAAMTSPLEVLKNDGMKRTLKAHVDPWGEVCLQDFQWNPKRKAVSPFRWSRGRRIWHYAGEIARSGVTVQEPLLFLEIQRSIFVTRTILITPWLRDKVDLGRIAMFPELRQEFDFDRLLKQAVDLVSRLHGIGFLHGDLKWSNFVVTADDRKRLILTDLDGVRKSSSRLLQGKDYARFALSAPAYGVDWVSPGFLIDQYLNVARGSDRWLRWSLRWHVDRKLGRYQR